MTFSKLESQTLQRHLAMQDQYASGAKIAPPGLEPLPAANVVGLEMKLSLYEPQDWPEMLSASQVAGLLHLAHTTVGRWCEDGTIEAVKLGRVRGVWRIPREAVWPLVPPSIRASWPDGPWKEQPERER
jgi:excisionase family DNA binding protein